MFLALLFGCLCLIVTNAQRLCMCGSKSGCPAFYSMSGECGGERYNCCATLSCNFTNTTSCGHAAGCFEVINFTISTPEPIRSAGCVAPASNETTVPCNASCADCVVQWSASWSPCSVSCSSALDAGTQTRPRAVVASAIGSGRCANRTATRTCSPAAPPCASQASPTGSQTNHTGTASGSHSAESTTELPSTATASPTASISKTVVASSETSASLVSGSIINNTNTLPNAPTDEIDSPDHDDVADSSGALSGTSIGVIAGVCSAVFFCGVVVGVVLLARRSKSSARVSDADPNPDGNSSEKLEPVYALPATAREDIPDGESDSTVSVGIYGSASPPFVGAYGPIVAQQSSNIYTSAPLRQ